MDLSGIITAGLRSQHHCIECWSDANRSILENDLNLVKLCILVAKHARQKPKDTSDCYLQINEHGTLLPINALCVEPDVVLSEHTFEDRQETLAVAVLVGTQWSNHSMTSFACTNNIFIKDCKTTGLQQIMMGIEHPHSSSSSSSSSSSGSRIFYEYARTHGAAFKSFLQAHVPSFTSSSSSSSSSTSTATESVMATFVLANVQLGGSYHFGRLFDANPHLETIALACTECGGTSQSLQFTSNGRRLGIGDSYRHQTTTLTSLLDSMRRLGKITSLDLSGNGLCKIHVEHLNEYLRSSDCTLTHLNLAYNSFDPSEKALASVFVESGGGSSKLQPLTEQEDVPPHPLVNLVVGGIRNNTSLLVLDLTGTCRFGMIDPNKSCDPDDRELMTR